MAEYPKIVLTNTGLDMIAESQTGRSLIFTKLKIGDGALGVGESISTLTALKSPKLDIPIQGFLNQGNGQVRLRYLVDNSGVPVNQGFFAREVGIYAKLDEGGTERLYAYTNGGNKVDWIPDKNTPMDAQVFDIFVLIGNASNVTVVINGSATYATVLDVKEHNEDENAHAELITKHNADLNAHADLLHIWQSHKTYITGDVCRPRSLAYPSWIFLECIQGGTSDVFEPPWPAVGEEVTDGTVRWRVRDIKSGSGESIGSIKACLSNTPPPGWLALDTGAMVSRATYKELWAWVQENAPLITEAEWQAQAAVQSSVGFYSSGDGSTTFRLPRILDYGRGGLAAEVGTWQEDMFKSHTHSITYLNNGSSGGSGTHAIIGTGTYNTTATGGTETRPKTIKFLFCVKAFDSVTDQGFISTTELANEVAEKQKVLAYIKVWDEKPSGTHGGTFTAGGWRTRDLNKKQVYGISPDSVTLASNQITLPPGVYIIRASAPGCNVDGHRIRLQNITTNATLLLGSVEQTANPSAASDWVQTNSILSGVITLEASTMELQHYSKQTFAASGFGCEMSSGEVEIYSQLELIKIG